MAKVIVIGAGVGGLTTAAVLARAGLDVTVLEAHIYPGGCAGTFYHQGYRFDAGATLAGGFYPGGPMDAVAHAAGIGSWPIHSIPISDPTMVVHLPDGVTIPRWADERRRETHRLAFGPTSEPFFRWQEATADALWDFTLRNPAWPPQTLAETAHLIGQTKQWLMANPRRLSPALFADAVRPVASHLKNAPENLRLFIDGQLLISAQTTSEQANALYGASALDLPRRGVVHLKGGIGAIAETLVHALRANGGQVIFRQEVTRLVFERGKLVSVETNKGQSFPADIVIANLPPWNIARLMGEQAPDKLKSLPPRPTGWGAFAVYVGMDSSAIPADLALHHQVITPRVRTDGWGEGSSIFLSLSPEKERERAPDGFSALTLSTHTRLELWWHLYEMNRAGYEARKQVYLDRMLDAAERVIPNLRAAANLILPGTPITFQRFTHREAGWVGGFPQTSLFGVWGPRIAPAIWMVGDSVFPGQSTAAVALGGLRVAGAVLREKRLTSTSQKFPELAVQILTNHYEP